MKLGEVTHYNLKSEQILAEGWQDLNEAQRIYVGKWEKDVWPLVEGLNKLLEADLDPKQIDKIFGDAEQVAIDSGNNKTALGKAGSVVGDQATKLTDQINKLADAAQQSGPIKNFDAQFEKLKAQLKKKLQGNPAGQKILTMVDGYGEFAKGNPAKAAFIIGAMTSVLAFASGGIVSGAAIGFFLKLANNTLKGDKLSTAVAKGVKGAAIGALAGALGDAMGDAEASELIPGVDADEAAEVSSTMDGDEVEAAVGADADADGGGETPELPDVDEFKENYIRGMLEKGRFANQEFTDGMVQKMANEVNIVGTYPDDIQGVDFKGTIVKGNIYLTPEEQADFSAYLKSQPGSDMAKIMSKETDEWLSANVSEADNTFQVRDDAFAARQAEIEADKVLDAAEVEGMSETDIQARMNEIQKSTNQVTGGKIDVENGKDALAREYRQLQNELNRREELNFSGATTDPTGLIQEYVEYLEETMNEGPALDKMKAAAMAGVKKAGSLTQKGMTQVGKGMDKAGAAVAGGISKTAAGIKNQGKQLGNKVTKEKLMKAWNKAGKPTDTGSIINILSDAGMDDEAIGTVGTQSNIKLARPQADTGDDAGASAGADPKAGAEAEPVDANKDGKDDKTGKPITKPVDANKDGKDDKTGKPIEPEKDATLGKPGAGGAAVGGAHANKKPIVPGGAKAGAGATAGKPVDVKALAGDIQKAGVADAVKQQLSQPAKAGSGGDLASGMKVDLPTLAKQISDAGIQDKVKASLTQKQPATA